ncbi:tRNA (guanine-N(2)-)-methyltransferase [Ignisphaera aggregans DSM 17230]|uniref:tRNA (guanine(26)-N(2))-dimethyltransferase n=1 Tax=Ignisphaera aggregans (strain DSM 17230 / JCM 13409 / AQ1.S1) TaxID=583356 RepID=E0SP54_IGNAA|nr:tRNA (guanine-N(2)-)-methyltransferase [Ignisphaera aggregans DSM 17230]
MSECQEDYVLVIEGLAKLCVPDPNKYKRIDNIYEPSWAPVFYNPLMVENRDIAVLTVRAMNSIVSKNRIVVLDPLAATGVRGIRIALEARNSKDIEVFMGDISKEAIDLMKFNAKLNNLSDNVHVYWMDANEYMHWMVRNGYSLDYIDIDPYGSPIDFISSALLTISKGGIIAITSTDLAVLEGKYREKLYRRYDVIGKRINISKDVAIRALLYYIARTASRFDRYVEPILAYVYRHYARVYVRVYKGASKAMQMLNECIGTIFYCERCGYSELNRDIHESKTISCPICGNQLTEVKPLWICSLGNKDFLDRLSEELIKMPWIQHTTESLIKYFAMVSDINVITIRLVDIARFLHKEIPQRDKLIKCLSEKGFKSVKSIYYSDGILTNANILEVIDCFNSI